MFVYVQMWIRELQVYLYALGEKVLGTCESPQITKQIGSANGQRATFGISRQFKKIIYVQNIDELVGFGRACAPVCCAHPSFRVHCHAKRGAARPHPAIAASLLLIRPPKIFTFYQTWDAHVKGFFLSTGPQRQWNKKSSSLLFLFLFLFLFFLFFSSYPSLLISSYTSRCDHTS